MPEGEPNTGPCPSLRLCFRPTHVASRHFPNTDLQCVCVCAEHAPLCSPTHVLSVRRSIATYIRL